MNKTGDILDLNIDELFQDNDQGTGTPPVTEEQKLNMTEAMTKRINEVKAKTETEVRDKVAKDLGFETYDDLVKAKNKKLITEAGYDPEEIESIIQPLLEDRLASDPRIIKLQQMEAKEQETYMNSELAEIEKLTGLKVTADNLPPETIELWKKGVKLSQAYIATNSTKIISAGTKGSTDHLSSGSGAGKTKLRTLTADEKAFYKSVNPYITDEELNKKTLEVK